MLSSLNADEFGGGGGVYKKDDSRGNYKKPKWSKKFSNQEHQLHTSGILLALLSTKMMLIRKLKLFLLSGF